MKVTKFGALVVGACALSVGAAELPMEQMVSVDFSQAKGKVRRELHSSGLAPLMSPRAAYADFDPALRELNLYATRTHDWALTNPGQRIIDTHFVFPLQHLDAANPSNYYFKATDEAIRLAQESGLKVFYRLGSSIELTEGCHFNVLAPTDFDNYAEALAGIVRHYTRGWADGFQYDIKYWELFNEPELNACWAGGLGNFYKLSMKCLKRLKSEFPELKFGGPAYAGFNPGHWRDWFSSCRKAGVKPDFFSWHYYGEWPGTVADQARKARKLLDENGLEGVELILDEWHYRPVMNGIGGSRSVDWTEFANVGSQSMGGIDSATFNLTVQSQLQDSPLGQSFYYGHGMYGDYGILGRGRRLNKVYYGLKAYGAMMIEGAETCPTRVKAGYETVTPFAVRTADGKKAMLLLTDYRSSSAVREFSAEVKGVEKFRRVSARVLDDARDLEPCAVSFEDGVLTWRKADFKSCALLVTWEM